MSLEPKMLPPEEWEPFFRNTDQYDIRAVGDYIVDLSADLTKKFSPAGAVNVLVNSLSAVVANCSGPRRQIMTDVLNHLLVALGANEAASFGPSEPKEPECR